jgi:hypothetical protein
LGEGETDQAATPRSSASARGSRGLPSCRRLASPHSWAGGDCGLL